MKTLKRKFTTWYYKKGYRFGYDDPGKSFDTYFKCPRWVIPLLIFFSPSVYFHNLGMDMCKWFKEGFNSVKDKASDFKEEINNAEM